MGTRFELGADDKDNSDPQYRTFRSGLPSLILLSSIYLLFSSIYARLVNPTPRSRSIFLATISVTITFVLHGTSAFKVLAILGLNYHVAQMPKPDRVARLWPGILVAGNMLVLLLNDRFDGYKYGSLFGGLGILVSLLFWTEIDW